MSGRRWAGKLIPDLGRFLLVELTHRTIDFGGDVFPDQCPNKKRQQNSG